MATATLVPIERVMYVMNDPALGYTPANWARLLAVATMPTMLIRKISGADAPASATITPVVKKRLKAGATCATPGMMTPNRPSWPRLSVGLGSVVVAIVSPFRAVAQSQGMSG